MGFYTAEYSEEQNRFHCDTLEHVISMNQSNALSRRTTDYNIIGIFDDLDKALHFCDDFRKRQKEGARTCRTKIL